MGVCGLELVLAVTGGRWFMALGEGRDVLGDEGVEADGDDGLGVVHVENVEVFGDCFLAAALGRGVFFYFVEDVAAVLEDGGWGVGLGPPNGGLGEVDVCGDEGMFGAGAGGFH